MVSGEAGVGESRLVREFAERSRGAGARVLIGGCLELGAGGLPFAPFISVLRGLVRTWRAGVAGLLPGGSARELARLLPEFGEPAGPDGGAEARARLFEQVFLLLERLADPGPVVLVVEDMHWADRSTRDLLAFLIRNQPSTDGLLMVVTYRSDDLHHVHPLRALLAELGRIGWVTRMELGRLTRPDTDRLIARSPAAAPTMIWLRPCIAGPRATRCSSRHFSMTMSSVGPAGVAARLAGGGRAAAARADPGGGPGRERGR